MVFAKARSLPLVLAGTSGLLAMHAGCATSPPAKTTSVMTAATQERLTPQSVLAELRAGNERFASGQSTSYDWIAQAEQTASGQYPKAIVLGCLDSRVPPEVIFDQGIGDMFVGRVAGNIEDLDQLGSMEFGVRLAGAKLIVVLGHSSCGAVKGAIDGAELGNLTEMLSHIEPAIVAVPTGSQGRTSKDGEYVSRVVEENVRLTVQDIISRSPVLAAMVQSGDLQVVGAVYDLTSGKVRWLDA